MRALPIRCLLLCLLLPACIPIGVTGQIGYAQMKVGGDLALATDSGSQSRIEQGVDSAFGLGDGQGSPYLRGQVDLGAPVITGSIFWLRENGQGQLAEAFGGLPQNTPVAARLDVGVAKMSAAYDIDLWLLKVAPGVMVDLFALDFAASSLTAGGSEVIDNTVFMPMPFVRAEAGLGPVSVVGEAGYIDVSGLGDTDGRILDVEAMIEVSPLPLGHLFAGYRYIGIDGTGDTESGSFAADLQISGWVVGGGVRF